MILKIPVHPCQDVQHQFSTEDSSWNTSARVKLLGNALCQESRVINIHIYTLFRFFSITLNSNGALCDVSMQRILYFPSCVIAYGMTSLKNTHVGWIRTLLYFIKWSFNFSTAVVFSMRCYSYTCCFLFFQSVRRHFHV